MIKINLRAARVNSGLTQAEAAKKIGITKDTLGNWERGKSFPSAKYIPLIEKVYNIGYDYIFLG